MSYRYRILLTSISYPDKYGHLKSSCPGNKHTSIQKILSSLLKIFCSTCHVELLSKPVWGLQENQFHFLIITLRISDTCYSACVYWPFFFFFYTVTSFYFSSPKQEKLWVHIVLQVQDKAHIIQSPSNEERLACFTRLWPLNKAWSVCFLQCPVSALWSPLPPFLY